MVTETLSIALAQVNFVVGDLKGNLRRIGQAVTDAEAKGASLVVFPELALTGYPPEDLLYRPDLYAFLEEARSQLCEWSKRIALLVGYPEHDGDHLYNAVGFFNEGRLAGSYYKRKLPNYGVFDEQRYFTAGDKPVVVTLGDHRLGLLICEDLWTPDAARETREAGADILVSINASPYEEYKLSQRMQVLSARCQETKLPVIYVNAVGGQDELVFDGNSLVLNAKGELKVSLPHCQESMAVVEVRKRDVFTEKLAPEPELHAALYQALVLAVRDYVEKNGFKSVLLGLSGGIDSALTLAIAVDALGPQRVRAVMMPYAYTAQMSVEDAEEQAKTLGCAFDIVPIEPMVTAFLSQLSPLFEGTNTDVTEENLQARCRGTLLMALSNKYGALVLATGNKSELAVGYCTLYGDMCGGFAPIKDLPKTLVYALSTYRNQQGNAIPQRVIDRPPSAELAPDQKDEDSLPPYDMLDEIIDGYVERDMSIDDLVAQGYPEYRVRDVIKLIERNEYKRRQGAIGPKVTRRNFSKDRRMPITHAYLKTMLE